MVDSRLAKVDLMEKVENLTILCKIREDMREKLMIKERPSGEVVVPTEEVLVLIKEDVILSLEEDFMVIILDVAKKDINLLDVDTLVKMKVVAGML